MNKIYIEGNYIIFLIDDVVNPINLWSSKYKPTALGWTIYDQSNTSVTILIAEIGDFLAGSTGDTYFTETSFNSFLKTNTGSNSFFFEGNVDANIAFRDSANLDSFSRLRVSNPTNVFDCQFTYDLQPTIFEQIINGTGATVTHDSTNRNALMTFASTPTGGQSIMQSYDHLRYQPLKSQLIAVTFNFKGGISNCIKFGGYSDGSNGFECRLNGTTPQLAILSTTSNGNQFIDQSNWSLDKFDGTGVSGLTIDFTKQQILIIDFQALYVGRVRMGFDIDGSIMYAHEFLHANNTDEPYIATANLPIRVGMTCTGTVSTTMKFNCSSVASEGGQEETSSYDFSKTVSLTATNGTRKSAISIRPRTTFNGIVNRAKIGVLEVEISVDGNSPVNWELCFGQALSGASYSNLNTDYSVVDFSENDVVSGVPDIISSSGNVSASNQTKSTIQSIIKSRYSITLDSVGAVRDLGTCCVVVSGDGGNSSCVVTLRWKEIR